MTYEQGKFIPDGKVASRERRDSIVAHLESAETLDELKRMAKREVLRACGHGLSGEQFDLIAVVDGIVAASAGLVALEMHEDNQIGVEE